MPVEDPRLLKSRQDKRAICERGRELYDRRIKHELTDDQLNEFIAIDVETGEFSVHSEHLEEFENLQRRVDAESVFVMRHGAGAVGYMGAPEADTQTAELGDDQHLMVDKRGRDFFRRHIRHRLSKEQANMIIAFDIDSGEFEADESMIEAGNRLQSRLPSSNTFFMRHK